MKYLLEKLLEGETLSASDAEDLITNLSSGECTDSIMASVMTVYRMRPVSTEELYGFRNGLMNLCKKTDLSEWDPIDVCGTGGDGKNSFNISTLAAFVLAGAGIKVAKHGNTGVSGISGSSTVLEYLGMKFTSDESQLKKQIGKANICFMHAPLFHPALKNVSSVRKQLGVKTFFNMLGPMINPCSPRRQLVGVYSLELARLYSYFFQQLKKEFIILHNLDGYDEISLTGPFKYFSDKGEVIGDASVFGLKNISSEEILAGRSVEDAAEIFISVLENSADQSQKNVVCANAALAILVVYPELNTGDAFMIAKESLESGRAKKSFEKLLSL